MAGRRLTAVSLPKPDEKAPDLRASVKTAIAAMDWLQESDAAMKALALRQAEEIEKAVQRANEMAEILREAGGRADVYKRLEKLEAMCDATKTVGWLGPQLQGVLRDLGGAPAARAALKKDKPVGSRLAALRDAAAQQD